MTATSTNVRGRLAVHGLYGVGIVLVALGGAGAGSASRAGDVVPNLVSGVGTGVALIVVGTNLALLLQRRRQEGEAIVALEHEIERATARPPRIHSA